VSHADAILSGATGGLSARDPLAKALAASCQWHPGHQFKSDGPLVAFFGEEDFAFEDAVDEEAVEDDEREADEGDGEHDGKRAVRGGAVGGREAVVEVGQRGDQVGVEAVGGQGEHGGDGEGGGEEGQAEAGGADEEVKRGGGADEDGDQQIKERRGEEGHEKENGGIHVGGGGGEVEDEEGEVERGEDAMKAVAKGGVGLGGEVDAAVHGEGDEGEEADEEGVGVEEGEKRAGVVAIGVDGDAEEDVTEGDAEEEGGEEGAEEEGEVPGAFPWGGGDFGAELDGDGTGDEAGEEEHEGDVEGGEDGGVDGWEGGEEGAAGGDEPDFVAVPDGADGVDGDAALVFVSGEEVEDADAEVEAVEDGVAGEEDEDEDEPDGLEEIEGHC